MAVKKRHVEIVVTYQDKYDYFELDWTGKIRYTKLRSDEKPNRAYMEYSSDLEFRCPFRTVYENEDENEYTFLVIGTGGWGTHSNVYYINKVTLDVNIKNYTNFADCKRRHSG